MKLHIVDILIICAYLMVIVAIGLFLKKKAAKNMDSYFLGGKSLPFYMLGLSNASGMFDITGTMLMVYWAFAYGFKSLWIPWLWPVFNQIFLMVYLSVWLRRSNVLTGAEWIKTRFGQGRGATLSHTIVIVFALLSVLGFLSYGFIGIGKFMEIFFPWEVVSQYVPWDIPVQYVPHFYGIFFTAIATFYVMLGGMLSIVWTDVVQFLIMTVAGVVIAIIGMNMVAPEMIREFVPAGWESPFFGWTLDIDWSERMSLLTERMADEPYSLMGVFVMMALLKGIFMSMAGPAPNYDMQKILSCKSPKEAALMSGSVSVILLIPRYLMIMGFALLAIYFFKVDGGLEQMTAVHTDFETILPHLITKYVPVGLAGLLLAGLLSAFMSTFASTVNAAPAYVVNDIYLKYINPRARRALLFLLGERTGFLCLGEDISVYPIQASRSWNRNPVYNLRQSNVNCGNLVFSYLCNNREPYILLLYLVFGESKSSFRWALEQQAAFARTLRYFCRKVLRCGLRLVQCPYGYLRRTVGILPDDRYKQ